METNYLKRTIFLLCCLVLLHGVYICAQEKKDLGEYVRTESCMNSSVCANDKEQKDTTIIDYYENGYIRKRSFADCNGNVAILMSDTVMSSELSFIDTAITVSRDASSGIARVKVAKGLTGNLKIYYADEVGNNRRMVRKIRLRGNVPSYNVNSLAMGQRGDYILIGEVRYRGGVLHTTKPVLIRSQK